MALDWSYSIYLHRATHTYQKKKLRISDQLVNCRYLWDKIGALIDYDNYILFDHFNHAFRRAWKLGSSLTVDETIWLSRQT